MQVQTENMKNKNILRLKRLTITLSVFDSLKINTRFVTFTLKTTVGGGSYLRGGVI